MARFEPNKPQETRESVILVEGLPLGNHVFRLVVVDDSGNTSEPDQITVTVRRVIG